MRLMMLHLSLQLLVMWRAMHHQLVETSTTLYLQEEEATQVCRTPWVQPPLKQVKQAMDNLRRKFINNQQMIE